MIRFIKAVIINDVLPPIKIFDSPEVNKEEAKQHKGDTSC